MIKLPDDFVAMPLWDYCILDMDEQAKSKIIIPETVEKDKVQEISTLELEVLFTGPDVVNIKPGDRIICNPQALTPFTLNEKRYFLISERATGVVVHRIRKIHKSEKGNLPTY